MKRYYSLYDRYAYPGKNKKIVVGTEIEILHAIHHVTILKIHILI